MNLQSELQHELESIGSHELEGQLENEQEFEQEFEQETELENEQELEQEAETELEQEGFLGNVLSGLGSLLGETELENEHEFEQETELENEQEFENEQEQEFEHGEQFFGKIFKLARRALPGLANAAGSIVGKTVSGLLPGPFGALASRGIQGLASMVRENELESYEFEQEQEQEQEQELGEHEVSNELAEHEAIAEALADLAARAQNELEAEALIGAATTITLSARDRRILRRLVPQLVRGAGVLTRVLRMRRSTAPFVVSIPTIVRRTAKTLSRGAQAGRPVTRQRLARTMARQTRRVLISPRYQAAVVIRNRRASRAIGRPVTLVRRRRAV